MSRPIFRQKSLDRISSPEQMDDYIRVASPGLWLLTVAVAILLVGICVWGVMGRVETTVKCTVVSGEAGVTLRARTDMTIGSGMKVIVGDEVGEVTGLEAHEDGIWHALVDVDLPAGEYRGKVVVESISPISLLFD